MVLVKGKVIDWRGCYLGWVVGCGGGGCGVVIGSGVGFGFGSGRHVRGGVEVWRRTCEREECSEEIVFGWVYTLYS